MASALASHPERADVPTRDVAARVMELGARATQDAALIVVGQLFGPARATSVRTLMGALR